MKETSSLYFKYSREVNVLEELVRRKDFVQIDVVGLQGSFLAKHDSVDGNRVGPRRDALNRKESVCVYNVHVTVISQDNNNVKLVIL